MRTISAQPPNLDAVVHIRASDLKGAMVGTRGHLLRRPNARAGPYDLDGHAEAEATAAQAVSATIEVCITAIVA